MFKHETQVIKFLLQWYSVNARNLPWRKKNNLNLPHPYFVFVSEYMLQQTTVNTVKNKFIQTTNFCISLCSIISYFLFGKSIALLFQVIISILLIINWQRIFKDWLFILYPIFGIFFTTFFGTRLSISGDQFWHVLIGPSGTISVLTFYLVLKRSGKKFT